MKITNLWDDGFARFLLSENTQIAKDLVEAALSDGKLPIKIKKIIPQARMARPEAHEVIYDALIETEDGILIDLEIQNYTSPDWEPRLALNDAYLAMQSLKPGEDYRKMRNRVIIGYCNFPLYDKSKPIYKICRKVEGLDRIIDDRGEILLVDATFSNHSGLLKEVLHDMTQSDPDKMSLPSFKETYEFLFTEKGEAAMSKWEQALTEKAVNKAVFDRTLEYAKLMLQQGQSKEAVIALMSSPISDESFKNKVVTAINLIEV